MNNYILKYITFIKQRGIFKFIEFIFRKCFLSIYKYNFKSCGSLFISGAFHITGKKNIRIGHKLSIGSRFRMDAITYDSTGQYTPEIVIGNNVSFGDDIHIGCVSKISIGNNVLLGSHIYITDHDHGIYDDKSSLDQSPPSVPPTSRLLPKGFFVAIGDNVFIGEYACITKGVIIGSGSVIGAHSVVNKNIPANSIAVGNPAKVIKKFDESLGKWIKV